MKSDNELLQDVHGRLESEPRIDGRKIAASVENGVATLMGHVETFNERWLAEDAVREVPGLRAVANDIEVELPTHEVRSDSELARKVADILEWHTLVPHQQISVVVSGGVVTLHGTVGANYQREAAIEAVRNMVGVRGVKDDIRVTAKLVAEDVLSHVRAALSRRYTLDADKIQVETKDGKVVLKGSVGSLAERDEAERAAWSAPGVGDVDDQIEVR